MREPARASSDRWISRIALRIAGLAAVVLLLTGLLLAREAEVLHVLFLQDYNTRLVVLATSLMGISSGVVGGFLLLRKRSLMGDALSHATLPGIAIAFMVLVALGHSGKQLGWLLFGAAISGLFGVALVLVLRGLPRIKEDTAMGIVLSVFYGGGVVLLGLIQEMPSGSAAGLEAFIYGKTASLVMNDFRFIVVITGSVLVVTLLLFKELRLLCFDENFAASLGWPVRSLDLLLLSLACAVTVSGLQAVGLILIIAFLIIPAAAARMWTSRLNHLLGIAALMGGLSGWIGATLSALLPRMPAGAVIVMVAACFFIISLIFGIDRGILVRGLRFLNLKRRIERQHLLRAIYELLEKRGDLTLKPGRGLRVDWHELWPKRAWSPHSLHRIARRTARAGLVDHLDQSGLALTTEGLVAAAKVTRNHRLWELYLIEYADIAPNHVDRDADSIEHILGERLTTQLQQSLPSPLRSDDLTVPASPHTIG